MSARAPRGVLLHEGSRAAFTGTWAYPDSFGVKVPGKLGVMWLTPGGAVSGDARDATTFKDPHDAEDHISRSNRGPYASMPGARVARLPGRPHEGDPKQRKNLAAVVWNAAKAARQGAFVLDPETGKRTSLRSGGKRIVYLNSALPQGGATRAVWLDDLDLDELRTLAAKYESRPVYEARNPWRKADLDRKAKQHPRFDNEWLDDDYFVVSTYGWRDEPYAGAAVDNDEWIDRTDGRAPNIERIVDFGNGWAVVMVDWR